MDLLLLSLILLSAVTPAMSDCPIEKENCPAMKDDCPSLTEDTPDTPSADEDTGDAPSANPDPYQFFLLQHTYSSDRWEGCNSFMKWLMWEMRWKKNQNCKGKNSVILGNRSDKTDVSAVDRVCGKEGTKTGQDYTSINRFRVVDCILTTRGEVYPKCKYKEQKREGHIVLRCDAFRNPEHFVGVVP